MSLSARDPFAMTADPEGYMPRAATERALAELERVLLAGEFPVVLTGPPGIGKTLLLRVIERKLAGRVRCVYLAYAALSAEDLCRWILGLLGEAVPENSDTEGALLAAAHGLAEAGTPLALLIDDASAIPPDTAERIGALASNSRGALQIVAADLEDDSAESWVRRFGARAERVRLDVPMSSAETALFIRARLQRGGGSPSDLARFDPKVIDRIFRRSDGVPRTVQALASEVLRVGQEALPGEALESLLTQEDAVGIAVRVAANRAAREIPPLEGTARAEDVPPPASVAPDVPVSQEASHQPLVSSAPVTPSLLQPKRERVEEASPPTAAEAVSSPTGSTPPLGPQEPLFPSLPPRRMAGFHPATNRPEIWETSNGGLHWPTILLAALALGGVLALAVSFLRNPRTIPPAPAIDTGTSAAARATTAPTPVPPVAVAPSIAPPRAEQPEAEARPEVGPSSAPTAPAPPVAGEDHATPISVDINATPWARIAVDGTDLGETPIAGALLTPGKHVFRAQMPDGDVIERTVQIGAGARHIAFPAGLAKPEPSPPKEPVSPPAEQPGTETPASQVATTRIAVGINATPWATIEVDGVEVGETPIAGVPLTPGSHLFRARMPDGRVIEKTVEIGAETRYVTFR